MKPAAIREMTNEELMRAIEDNRREALNLRLQAQTGQLENTARIRTVRRDVSRFMTEQKAREQQNRNVDR
jgi:large subunit ribosomal protein L29